MSDGLLLRARCDIVESECMRTWTDCEQAGTHTHEKESGCTRAADDLWHWYR